MNRLLIFRALIILEWFLIIPEVGLSLMLEGLLPEDLQYWLIRDAERELDPAEMLFALIFIPLLVLGLVGSVGLFFQQKWGVWIYLGTYAFMFCLYPFIGPTVEHALVSTISYVGWMISGVILGMIFFTNVVLDMPLSDKPKPHTLPLD
jgi:hypothetical protein